MPVKCTTKNIACLLLILISCLGRSVFSCARNHQFAQITKGPVGEIGPRCSPDGRYLAFEYFSTEHSDAVQVWLMPPDRFSDARPLLGYSGMSYGEISWSPDGGWLSFVGGSPESDGVLSEQVFKINIANRQITQLTYFPARTSLGGTSWSRDGRILFEMDDDIYVVPQTGGTVAKLLDVNTRLPGVNPFFPSWSPDATRVAFVGRTAKEHSLYVADLDSNIIEKIFSDVGDDGPSWLDDSRILCSRVEGQSQSSLWLVRVREKNGVRLTQGFYDIGPVACVSGEYMYFARNADISRFSGPMMRGFHIWRVRMRNSSD